MRPPLTEWPDDEAPLSEWLRPLSATIENQRVPMPAFSGADPTLSTSEGGRWSNWTLALRARQLAIWQRRMQ